MGFRVHFRCQNDFQNDLKILPDGARVDAEAYGTLSESEDLNYFISLEPMSEYKFLLQKQTAQLLKLYGE